MLSVAGMSLFLAAALLGAADAQLDAGTVSLTPGQRQLFLDDLVVQEITGLTRTMHKPEKRGAVLKPDIPSDGVLIQIRSAPMWVPEEGRYKILYDAYGRDPKNSVGMALATSKDGVHWEKPILGETEVNGNKNNNWIAIAPGLAWPDTASEGVICDPKDPDPNRRFKALQGAINRRPIISPDCIHWTRLGTVEIPSSDESQLVQDEIGGRFLAMVKTGNEYGRAFSISMSSDFEHWMPNRFLFGADAEDQKMAPDVIRRHIKNPNMLGPLFVDPDPATGWKPPAGEVHQPTWRAEVYNIAVFPYEGVYVGLPSMYYPTGTCLPERNNTDGFHEIQLVMSRDLESWKRLGDRQAFIEPSGVEKGRVGVYDRTQLLAANRPVVQEKELWFYYSGLKWRDAIYDLNPDGSPRDPKTLTDEDRADIADGWGAMCLTVLRRDGFVSLDAAGEGCITTKPLKFVGKSLFLNISAPKGQATVEILGADGKPVPGFAQQDAVPVVGDDVRIPVSWKGGTDVGSLAGKTVALRIYLKAASLYAFWVE